MSELPATPWTVNPEEAESANGLYDATGQYIGELWLDGNNVVLQYLLNAANNHKRLLEAAQHASHELRLGVRPHFMDQRMQNYIDQIAGWLDEAVAFARDGHANAERKKGAKPDV